MDWVDVAMQNGIVGFFLMLIAFGVWKAGSWLGQNAIKPLVAKHITTLDSVCKTQEQQAVTMQKIGDRVEQSGKSDAAQHRAAAHFGRALIELAPDDKKEDVRGHIGEAVRELGAESK